MTRTILATAAALVAAATLSTTAANACVSCEYVPEVVRSSSTLPHTGHYYAAKPYIARKPYIASKEHAAPAKRRVVKSEPVAPKLDISKVEAKAEKKVTKVKSAETTDVAKAEPTEKKAAESENSSISLASNDDAAAVKATVVKAVKEVTAKPTDCKKFFASVGMTLTVPCE